MKKPVERHNLSPKERENVKACAWAHFKAGILASRDGGLKRFQHYLANDQGQPVVGCAVWLSHGYVDYRLGLEGRTESRVKLTEEELRGHLEGLVPRKQVVTQIVNRIYKVADDVIDQQIKAKQKLPGAVPPRPDYVPGVVPGR